MKSYDIVIIGGGMAGAALAKAMAEKGCSVLVVERETQFKDRIRGEALAAWGVESARDLGLFDSLSDRCGHMLQYWNVYAGGDQVIGRDLFATTPQKAGWFCYYHPEMQEIVLEGARAAGAAVRRGARVRALEPGSPARVTIEEQGRAEEVTARLVVGADGRSSSVRKWAGFETRDDPPKLFFSGVLLENVQCPRDVFYHLAAPGFGFVAYLFPLRSRVRAYFGWHKDTGFRRLQGAQDVGRFVEAAEKIGMPREFFAEARPVGPLATFEGADSWVDHPYRGGVALIGDAAATSDPTWGQGMSLALRDVRALRDALLAERDWDAACHAYAATHDRHYAAVHVTEGWVADVFMEVGPEADARRARALPLLVQDPTRFPDVAMSGPDAPHDDSVRRRFFGEE